MLAIECLKAILYGIVEGVTEWLPISSTGHLILLSERLPFAFCEDGALLAEFLEMFDVVIQLGAILAVAVIYWRRLCPWVHPKASPERRASMALWGRVIPAGIPAALVGIVGDRLLLKWTGRDIDGWLYTSTVVAAALIVYGVAFLWMERRHRLPSVSSTNEITAKHALAIGAFQALSILPGTSRSGSTILGASLMGVSRPCATEFSFFLAIPVMLGAGGIKLLGFFSYLSGGIPLPPVAWLLLLLGALTAFLVSLIAIRFLTDFIKRHSFVPFGIYRILLGSLVLADRFL